MAAERTPVIQLTLDLVMQAIEVIKNSKYVDKTNLISVNPVRYGIEENIQLYFKMEGQQNAGSFKIRGIINQLEAYSDMIQQDDRTLITMSAGNYGRAFAYMCREMGYAGLVLIPTTAPANRVDLMRSFGVTVEPTPLEELQPTIDRYVRDRNMMYMHPFDDVNLIAGYCSVACELYNQLDHIDIILVCCGGGGLLSGIASYAKLTGRGTNTRIASGKL
jgi:threonine dehydratase